MAHPLLTTDTLATGGKSGGRFGISRGPGPARVLPRSAAAHGRPLPSCILAPPALPRNRTRNLTTRRPSEGGGHKQARVTGSRPPFHPQPVLRRRGGCAPPGRSGVRREIRRRPEVDAAGRRWRRGGKECNGRQGFWGGGRAGGGRSTKHVQCLRGAGRQGRAGFCTCRYRQAIVTLGGWLSGGFIRKRKGCMGRQFCEYRLV